MVFERHLFSKASLKDSPTSPFASSRDGSFSTQLLQRSKSINDEHGLVNDSVSRKATCIWSSNFFIGPNAIVRKACGERGCTGGLAFGMRDLVLPLISFFCDELAGRFPVDIALALAASLSAQIAEVLAARAIARRRLCMLPARRFGELQGDMHASSRGLQRRKSPRRPSL